MTPIVKQDVIDFDSTLSTVPDAVWTKALAVANEINLTSDDTDADRTLARIYLAAHWATLMKPGSNSSAAGPVISESVGGIRRSYANTVSATTENSLRTTKYGRAYLELLAMTFCNGPHLGD